ncbi:hypothetical protein N9C07_03575 [Flavobacteriaceae bacterium]|jgi:hypothetical protein|nr:hypothetical protein [Flavobacteriaceae bacterium]MDA7698924.1 hypothetical protein [Flavobacteriaceae bacterium]MDA9811276.1 hypothetical protein [Flavobacteriaceae bacterium]MDC1542298.1 hypothetical protein [Flavobacteriaceae bacterium]|tara:strand:- start:9478 stop:10164 length:687 start_codon:yes stop_codon:yes gene_type:complete
MKLNALPRTNVKVALDKIRAYELTANEQETALKTLYDSFEIRTTNAFNFDLLDRNKIYHLEQIKKVSINYRLRFLDLKYFKNKLPESAHQDIQQLEALHETHLSGFKIMAPSALFRLEKADDPLLFAPLGNDFYYLVHKWGNDLHPLRRLMMLPFKNIWNLLGLVLAISFVVTEIMPKNLFTKSPDASTYWMLLFFNFKAIASVVLFYGFALGKNFNPAIWNNKYNKA